MNQKVSAYNANSDSWRNATKDMRIVYDTEKTFSGTVDGLGHGPDAEPGHKERFDALLKKVAKQKK